MHLPAATVGAMGALMSGHASNAQVVTLMQSMSPGAQTMVMAQMPVVGSHVIVGAILHFAFAAFIGVVFAAIVAGTAWLRLPGLRTSWGVIAAGVIGGALLYVVMRWGILPPINPMMGLVPEGWFFVAHLLYGFVVGVGVALMLRRPSVRAALPAPAG
jgi:tetrahydromethanopterin S-methyltransferase subunit B